MISFLENVPGGSFAVLAAFLVGLLGVLLLCVALRCASSKTTKNGSSEGEELDSKNDDVAKQHPKSKGLKLKQQPSTKKLVLPPHPLLAAEFKGHTGAVLSLDFDSNGRYLASCSDGELE